MYIRRMGESVPVKRLNIGNGIATFIGDTHGALDISSYAVMKSVESDLVCFLGDIVDRGEHQLLNLLFLLESSIISTKIIIIRGNHESPSMNSYYGFKQELVRLGLYDILYKEIVELYGVLPYACLVNDRVLGVHGGIPRDCMSLDDWDGLPMGDEVPSDPCAFEILWNDPSEILAGFEPGVRGEGTYLFGKDAFSSFMKENNLDLLVRGHQVKAEGVESMFRNRLVTVFSSKYHGGKAGILEVEFRPKVVFTAQTVTGQETGLPFLQ
ncbi:MAG TPA: metallophosphoesterase [Thermoplasmataceae archaeon]|nr:metallophosphoesterase [Thermoplasmataceae archaeon]